MATYHCVYRKPTAQERFTRFLAIRPDVYANFRTVAQSLLDRGVTHFGAKAIVEVLRYQAVMAGTPQPECDNDYIGWMARRLADEDARFANFFEMRRMKR